MSQTDLQQQITPFIWMEHDDNFSVCLMDVGHYKQTIFDSRADEGFEGNGYDWQSLATVFVTEQLPELADIIHFDSESSMFCAYASDKQALQRFIVAFKTVCDNDVLILDIFSRAELD